MAGLLDRGGGSRIDVSDSIQRAHQAWEESMLRQVDELKTAVRNLPLLSTAVRCGGTVAGSEVHLNYWQKKVGFDWETQQARFLPDGESCSLFDTSVLLYYLKLADGTLMADRWISFRELPGGAFYNQAFQGYSGNRLAQEFGVDIPGFHQAATKLNGSRLSGLTDCAYAFLPLPCIRLAAVLWPGDEDFPTQGTILFDAAASHYLTTDGLAILGSGLVSRLIKAST
jgi:hypothetical protein